MRESQRSTYLLRLSSSTVTTSTSLSNCFARRDIPRSSASTTTVNREKPVVSVRPTLKLSML